MVATGAGLKAHAEPARVYRPPPPMSQMTRPANRITTAVDARDLA